MKEDIKLTITINQLQFLLDKQKELTGEAICKVAHQITVDGKTDTSVIRNSIRDARYPADFDTLKRYLQ